MRLRLLRLGLGVFLLSVTGFSTPQSLADGPISERDFVPSLVIGQQGLPQVDRNALLQLEGIQWRDGALAVPPEAVPHLSDVLGAREMDVVGLVAAQELLFRPDFQSQMRGYDPEIVRDLVDDRLKAEPQQCKLAPGLAGCQKREAILTTLRGLEAVSAECRQAAERFQRIQVCRGSACKQHRRVIENFDAQCLYQPTEGTGPAAMSQGAADGLTALDVTVVIQHRVGPDRWTHLCGGLILSGERILTARHCLNYAGQSRFRALSANDWRAVRLSDGRVLNLSADGVVDRAPSSVADDYLILPLVLKSGDAPVRAAKLVLREASWSSATVVGYFDLYNTVATSVASLADVRSAIRAPRPGLCHVVEVRNRCVRTICQTVPGYSGSPLFANARDPDGALVLYGLISAPAVKDSLQCDAPTFGLNSQGPDTVSTSASLPPRSILERS